MAPKDEAATLKQFREELVKEDLLHDGDSIGTDDETLLYVLLRLARYGHELIFITDDSFVRDISTSRMPK